ncbi:hypothetical protein [Kytococcus sedentarius]|uniref:hypothetical protein n=1 Tax=Kytococcus sedentarius TaxID=1276 RepID=UPI0035BBCF81
MTAHTSIPSAVVGATTTAWVEALITGGLLAGAGLLLGLLCLWWRWGRSRAARWWVRTTPVDRMRSLPLGEAMALVLLPATAVSLAVLGGVVALSPAIREGGSTATLWLAVALVGGLCALLVVARFSIWFRWVLPLWMYPAWLRPQRRADAEWLRQVRGR